MKGKLVSYWVLASALLLPQHILAWNDTGHKLVARIAWDDMTPTTRQNVIALLLAAPQDACLLDLFSNDNSRPLDERQRELFVRASTWPDIVRPREADTRPCIRFHRRDWHFINFFWEGISGDTNDPPQDRTDIQIPEINIVERLKLLRPFVACSMPSCGTTQAERATALAWILHLAGDIHQPLHTSARVTRRRNERQGDQGGNLFTVEPFSLHSFWDGIVSSSMPRQEGESEMAYLDRLATRITGTHPRSQVSARLLPGNYEAWAREGFETTKRAVYPQSLRRDERPSDSYRAMAFATSEEAIAIAGYRLADLLNQMFGS